MTFMGQDYHECRQTLRYLQRNLSVDLAYLACACRGTSLLRTLVVHDNTVVGPYLVPGGTAGKNLSTCDPKRHRASRQ